jgi:hypothetical protein
MSLFIIEHWLFEKEFLPSSLLSPPLRLALDAKSSKSPGEIM